MTTNKANQVEDQVNQPRLYMPIGTDYIAHGLGFNKIHSDATHLDYFKNRRTYFNRLVFRILNDPVQFTETKFQGQGLHRKPDIQQAGNMWLTGSQTDSSTFEDTHRICSQYNGIEGRDVKIEEDDCKAITLVAGAVARFLPAFNNDNRRKLGSALMSNRSKFLTSLLEVIDSIPLQPTLPAENWDLLTIFRLIPIKVSSTDSDFQARIQMLKKQFLVLLFFWVRKREVLDQVGKTAFINLQKRCDLETLRVPPYIRDSTLLENHQKKTLQFLSPRSLVQISMVVHRTGSGKTRTLCTLADMFSKDAKKVMIVVNSEATRLQTYLEMWDLNNGQPNDFRFFPGRTTAPTFADTKTLIRVNNVWKKKVDEFNRQLIARGIIIQTYDEFTQLCKTTVSSTGNYFDGLRAFSRQKELEVDDSILYIFDEAHTLLNDKRNGGHAPLDPSIRRKLADMQRVCLISATPFGEKMPDLPTRKQLETVYHETYQELFQKAPTNLTDLLLVYNGHIDQFRRDCIFVEDNHIDEKSVEKKIPVDILVKKFPDEQIKWQTTFKLQPNLCTKRGTEAEDQAPLFYLKIKEYIEAHPKENILILANRPHGVDHYYRLFQTEYSFQSHTFVSAGFPEDPRSDGENTRNENRNRVILDLYDATTPSRLTYRDSATKPVCLLMNEMTDSTGLNLKGFTVGIITTVYNSANAYLQAIGRINRMCDPYIDKRHINSNKVIIMIPKLGVTGQHARNIVDQVDGLIAAQNLMYTMSLNKRTTTLNAHQGIVNLTKTKGEFEDCAHMEVKMGDIETLLHATNDATPHLR